MSAPSKHTPITHTHEVVRREAERRGLRVSFGEPIPEDVPDEIRHAAFVVSGQGWHVWAMRGTDDGLTVPADRHFIPLAEVLESGYSLVGYHSVHVP